MRVSTLIPSFALVAFALAQSESLAPSPTESIGCEPHGDHWHCDGPAPTGDVVGTGSLAPSPTESIGCEPHGDHWHCDGPAVETTPVVIVITPSAIASATESVLTTTALATLTEHSHSEGEEDHEHTTHDEDEPMTGMPPPSPTESVGCEPHGDHWHCDGPAVTGPSTLLTTSTETDATATETEFAPPQVTTNAAAPFADGARYAAFAGLAGVALFV
ncbi:hypothetical protein M501DRAFT_146015 [Patellaria atrata CBS 101060]|uniref:Uncharacterized protein n=1 Tax=Patellaria atrata CBS 101060 TaxID=1346257 RepID=A0A9P4S8D6_9PEZI|nr:hypothetical protein M501DRAFT_146015 [Patellaria atrata CBS 101060]